MKCSELQEIIKKKGFEVTKVIEDEEKCIVDFKHPKIKVEPPVAYFLSSAVLNKKDNSIETTVRSKVEDYKELYLDYCCEGEEQVCRPHVSMEEKILSVEARFHKNPKEKFERLLDEIR
jgi:hypothetical protein